YDKVDSELIRDRIILMGYTSISFQDVKETPYSAILKKNRLMPGVVVHAQIVSQILSSVLDDRPLIWYFPWWVEWFFIWVCSVVGGLLTWRKIRSVWLVVVAEGAGIILLCLIGWGGMVSFALWLPLGPSMLALGLTAFFVLFVNRVETLKKRLRIDVDIDWDLVRQEADKWVPRTDASAQETLEDSEKDTRLKWLQEIQEKAQQRRKQPRAPKDELPLKPSVEKKNYLQEFLKRLIPGKKNLQENKEKRLGVNMEIEQQIEDESEEKAHLKKLLRKARRLINEEAPSVTEKEKLRTKVQKAKKMLQQEEKPQ
ncbi:MAG: CHASE2 domain-containing protein, partial [Moorea sp. SIO2B7]|nr:CHASE2 domain-containing protein [Moorena sp. SIO2B7]